jgi:hypothetical protein
MSITYRLNCLVCYYVYARVFTAYAQINAGTVLPIPPFLLRLLTEGAALGIPAARCVTVCVV